MWRKRSKKGRSKKIKILLIFFLFLLFIGGLIIFIAKFPFFTINTIDTVLNNVPCVSENQIKESSGILGQSFFRINFKNITGNLKNKFICIKEINTAYTFPNKVKIIVTGRQPVFRLLSLKTGESSSSGDLENIATPSAEFATDVFLIDKEGVIFSKDPAETNTPGIFVSGLNLTLGQISKNIHFENILKIFEKTSTFGLGVKNTILLDNYLILFSDPKVVFKLDVDVDMQLASLQLILSEAKINLRKLEFIDLRFDKPIVRFAPKKNG